MGSAIPIDEVTRIGKATPRAVSVKLHDVKDKAKIFEKVSNLKEMKNSKDQAYYINNQLPPRQQEQQRKFRKMIKYNASLNGVGKRELTMKKGELLVDGYPYRPPVTPPLGGKQFTRWTSIMSIK